MPEKINSSKQTIDAIQRASKEIEKEGFLLVGLILIRSTDKMIMTYFPAGVSDHDQYCILKAIAMHPDFCEEPKN